MRPPCHRAREQRGPPGTQRLDSPALKTFPQVNAAAINLKLAGRGERLPPNLRADGILLSAAAGLRGGADEAGEHLREDVASGHLERTPPLTPPRQDRPSYK